MVALAEQAIGSETGSTVFSVTRKSSGPLPQQHVQQPLTFSLPNVLQSVLTPSEPGLKRPKPL